MNEHPIVSNIQLGVFGSWTHKFEIIGEWLSDILKYYIWESLVAGQANLRLSVNEHPIFSNITLGVFVNWTAKLRLLVNEHPIVSNIQLGVFGSWTHKFEIIGEWLSDILKYYIWESLVAGQANLRLSVNEHPIFSNMLLGVSAGWNLTRYYQWINIRDILKYAIGLVEIRLEPIGGGVAPPRKVGPLISLKSLVLAWFGQNTGLNWVILLVIWEISRDNPSLACKPTSSYVGAPQIMGFI